MRKKIGISLFMGMSIRNFELAGIFQELNKDFDLVFFTTSEKVRDYIGNNYQIQMLPSPSPWLGRILAQLEPIQYYAFHFSRHPKTSTKYILRDRDLTPFKWLLWSCLGRLWSKIEKVIPVAKIYTWLGSQWDIDLSKVEELFLLSYDVSLDKLLAGKAASMGKPIHIAVHSWDNLPGRGYLPVIPTKLLVWNENMKSQALTYHKLPPHLVTVFGAPQFRFYLNEKKSISLKLLEKIDPRLMEKNYIVYCCSASRVFPDEAQFIEELAKISLDKKLLLVLRLHPNERKNEYIRKFGTNHNIILSVAGDFFSASIPRGTESGQLLQETYHFMALMKYSITVINLASTTSMDAIVHDTPAICVKFNLDPKMKSRWNQAARWYESDHYDYMNSGKALLYSHNLRELACQITECLEGRYPLDKMREMTSNFVTDLDPRMIVSQIFKRRVP